MGVMRFLISPTRILDLCSGSVCAFITGLDGRVHPSRTEIAEDILMVRRNQHDSGKLHIPFPVEGYGCPVIVTTSLPEREEPWHLTLELARGKLGEIRDQAQAWEQARMQIPHKFLELSREAFRFLIRAGAARSDTEACGELALQSLNRSFQASALLADAYVFQRSASRRQNSAATPTLLGSRLEPETLGQPAEKLFYDAFSAVAVPIEWRSIEAIEGQYDWEPLDRLVDAAQQRRLVMRGGPLIDLAANGLPPWLKPWENDPLNLPSFACDFVETAVTRYQGRIRIWEVAAYSTPDGPGSLSEEHRLGLVARVLEAASGTESDAQFFVRIDRPWGEHLASGQSRLSPFQFVDALLRSNIGLGGVNLEIAVGYGSRGSWFRDPLAFSRMIDSWSLLGLPLHVTLAYPSRPHSPEMGSDLLTPCGNGPSPNSEQAQADWLGRYVPVIMSKPAVIGVFIDRYHDSPTSRYPHSGILDATGNRKMAYDVVRGLRHL